VIPSLKRLDWRGFLARPQLPSPPDRLNALKQRPILITGAGGSIGSALALRLATIGVSRLVLLEASESNLYALQRDWTKQIAQQAPSPRTEAEEHTSGAKALVDLADLNVGAEAPTYQARGEGGLAALQDESVERSCAATSMRPVLGSAADRALLEEIFSTHRPAIVFHAAAFKHVPLMEEQPLAAIANNIFGTETLTQAAAENGARVVLLSTDKAVEPASVMGATKRVAEQIVLNAGGTVLRLGNVLASRDSVAEVFAAQIKHGGPVMVTDPAARRYFLTLDEAVNLLLAAATHPEPGTLLAPVLAMTHSIEDMARFMAQALRPDCEIAIEFTGRRAGDKQTERMWKSGERTSPASLDGVVQVETNPLTGTQLESRLATLRTSLQDRDVAEALGALRALVPDFTPSRAVLNLAQPCSQRVCL
jgi:FlaA1/EpsC-like NDP-sugar epimerase